MSQINVSNFPLDIPGDHLAQAAGAFEPQRQNNWLITVPGIPGDRDITLSVESAALPSVGLEEVELAFLNLRKYVAGRVVYDALPLVMKDMVDVGTASAIKAWSEQVFNPTTFKIGLARDYKKEAELVLFAPEGSYERSWTLVGTWPMNVTYGTLDMSSSDKVLIEATLRYDYAIASGF